MSEQAKQKANQESLVDSELEKLAQQREENQEEILRLTTPNPHLAKLGLRVFVG